MNIHQFRFVRETVRQNFNLTEAAKTLFTSQPGVSKAIIELEDELGVDIFIRRGKRIRSLTEPGQKIFQSIEKILNEIETLKKIGKEYVLQDQGNLTIAATHTQARYSLPSAIAEFKKRFPKVRLSLLQGSPEQVCEMVINDQVDLAIATEAIENYPNLISLPCYEWTHVIAVTSGHPLLDKPQPLTLEDLLAYPIITYERHFAGRKKIDQAFKLRNLIPDIILEAIDSDVIKTYVEMGLGVGIMSNIAYSQEKDRQIHVMPAEHLFGKNITRIALKQDSFLRSYIYTLLEILSPNLTRKIVDQALNGKNEYYEL